MKQAGLPTWLQWHGPVDMLKVCRQDISGVTSPQIYLKSPGAWTGGHEENLRYVLRYSREAGKALLELGTHVGRLYSVNVNHGPGVSEWYAVSPEHAHKLRDAIVGEFGVDITAGGCWFPSLDFCQRHAVPVMFGLQQPGDVIVLNGACVLGPAAVGLL